MKLGSEVVVAVGEPGVGGSVSADPSVGLGNELAAALGLPLRMLHVEAEPDDVAAAIADGLSPTSILVIHSEHANRWSGKWSIAEHVIDQWGGLAIAIGPCYTTSFRRGSVLTAVDGSAAALRVVEPARAVAATLDRSIQLCQVIPASDASDQRVTSEASMEETVYLVGNDPISSLLAHAATEDCRMIVLAARGNRASTRTSISRTCAGIIAGAEQPVMIVGTQWEPMGESTGNEAP